MTVEASTYINTLNASYPAATDPKSEGDDHIRAIKSAVKLTFPNVTGPVTATQSELSSVAGKLNAANPTYTGTLTGGTGVINIGSGQLYKDASGNFGLGVTPSDWSAAAGAQALQIGGLGAHLLGTGIGWSATPFFYIGNNAYHSSGVWRYSSAQASAQYEQSGGQHIWKTAPSGTAGNPISFTQAMTLDANGNLLVGTTSNGSGARFVSYGSFSFFANGTYAGYLGAGSSLASGAAASDFCVRSDTNLVLATNGGFERARIDTSGNLLVGAMSGINHRLVKDAPNAYAAGVTNTSVTAPNGLILETGGTSGAGGYFLDCYNQSGFQMRVASTGNITNTNNSYGAISDLKLKENITDVTPKLAKLMQVRIVNYTLKADPTKAKLIGVIAQELEQISPGLIEETPDFEEVAKTREVKVPAVEAVLDDECNEVTPAIPATTRTEEYTERVPTGTVTKSVKYSVFVPMLIKGVQEQQAQIEALQSQLDAQNTAMQLLVARLEALEAK